MIRAGLGSLNKVMRSKLNSAMSVPVWARSLTSAHIGTPAVILQYFGLRTAALHVTTSPNSYRWRQRLGPCGQDDGQKCAHRQTDVCNMQIVAFCFCNGNVACPLNIISRLVSLRMATLSLSLVTRDQPIRGLGWGEADQWEGRALWPMSYGEDQWSANGPWYDSAFRLQMTKKEPISLNILTASKFRRNLRRI